MRTDSRGRIRFTHQGIRYEINNKGVLRTYARGATQNADSERAIKVPVLPLRGHGMSMLYRAVNTYHQNTRVTLT